MSHEPKEHTHTHTHTHIHTQTKINTDILLSYSNRGLVIRANTD